MHLPDTYMELCLFNTCIHIYECDQYITENLVRKLYSGEFLVCKLYPESKYAFSKRVSPHQNMILIDAAYPTSQRKITEN